MAVSSLRAVWNSGLKHYSIFKSLLAWSERSSVSPHSTGSNTTPTMCFLFAKLITTGFCFPPSHLHWFKRVGHCLQQLITAVKGKTHPLMHKLLRDAAAAWWQKFRSGAESVGWVTSQPFSQWVPHSLSVPELGRTAVLQSQRGESQLPPYAAQGAGGEMRENICSIILGLWPADRKVALLSEHLKSRLLSQLHAFLKVHRLLTGNFMERGNKRGGERQTNKIH